MNAEMKGQRTKDKKTKDKAAGAIARSDGEPTTDN